MREPTGLPVDKVANPSKLNPTHQHNTLQANSAASRPFHKTLLAPLSWKVTSAFSGSIGGPNRAASASISGRNRSGSGRVRLAESPEDRDVLVGGEESPDGALASLRNTAPRAEGTAVSRTDKLLQSLLESFAIVGEGAVGIADEGRRKLSGSFVDEREAAEVGPHGSAEIASPGEVAPRGEGGEAERSDSGLARALRSLIQGLQERDGQIGELEEDVRRLEEAERGAVEAAGVQAAQRTEVCLSRFNSRAVG